MNASVLWEYDTRVWTQRLEEAETGWLLSRSIRGLTDEDRARRAEVLRGLSNLSSTSAPTDTSRTTARFVTPTSTDGTSRSLLSAPHQVATRLWPSPAPEWADARGVEGIRRLSGLLLSLHALKHDLSGIESPHLGRLASYLDADAQTPSGQLLNRLPDHTVETMRTWLRDLPRHGVLCHGGWSLGSVFATEDIATIEMVVGDELVASIPELDLGWMVGELTEYEYEAGLSGADGSTYARAAFELVEAYREGTSRDISDLWIQRVAALRYLLHQCDFSETTGSADRPDIHLNLIPWLVERASDAKGNS